MSLQVVNLGLPKSGTTTLAKALRMGGFRVADHRIRGRNTALADLKGTYVGDLVYRGYFETGDPGAHLPNITAITEMSVLNRTHSLWPQTDFALIQALRSYHPGVKFLASRRDAFEMSQSMLGWSNLGTERLPDGSIPGLPRGFGDTGKEREQWINGHYATLRHMFRDAPDFLEFDVANPESHDKIAGFLQCDLPWWGKLNANPARERA
ncbi:MAG: hypothetical protein AB8B51_22010 [Sedimentitalea sp.]